MIKAMNEASPLGGLRWSHLLLVSHPKLILLERGWGCLTSQNPIAPREVTFSGGIGWVQIHILVVKAKFLLKSLYSLSIRSHSSARFYFELSENSNYIIHCNLNYVQNFELEINSI